MEEFRSNAMAVLNIKNLPDSLYKKLPGSGEAPAPIGPQEVTHLLSDALETPKLCRFLISRVGQRALERS